MLAGAVDLAREAAEDVAREGHVGEHVGFEILETRVGTHFFASMVPGYAGWRWAVTVARVPRGRTPSVSEVELVPGDGALLAPDWVPWADRLRPGDVGPNDVLPFVEDDARLVQAWEFTGDDDDLDRAQVTDLGLERERVLSRLGREEAMQRWYDGAGGPNTPAAKNAAASCDSCGFFLRLPGTASRLFGVCSNEWSEDDGRVVSIDHGCGAHSETRAPTPAALWDATEPVIDEWDIQIIGPQGEDGENAADPDDGAAETSRPARQRRRTTRRATDGDTAAEGEAPAEGAAKADAEAPNEGEAPVGGDSPNEGEAPAENVATADTDSSTDAVTPGDAATPDEGDAGSAPETDPAAEAKGQA